MLVPASLHPPEFKLARTAKPSKCLGRRLFHVILFLGGLPTWTDPEKTYMCCWQDTRAGAKEIQSEQHKERHAETTNPFRLVVFIALGLTTVQSAISLSSSGHK